MARAVFEIARDFQDKIFGDLAQANSFADMARETTLADFKIPEQLSTTRLNNMNNQFALQDRANTFQTDLAANGIASQTGLRQAQLDASTFDIKAQTEKLALDNALSLEKASKMKFQALAKNQELVDESIKLGLEKEISETKATLMENMSSFEKYQAENEYNNIISEIPDWEDIPPGQRPMIMWDKAKAKNVSKKGMELIKLKIKEELNDDIAQLQSYEDNQLKIAAFTRISNAGGELSSSQKAEMSYLIEKQNSIQTSASIDFAGLKFVVDRGIIPYSELGLASADLIKQMTAVQPIGGDLAGEMGGERTPVPAAAAAPAPAAPAPAAPAPTTVAETAPPEADLAPVPLTERDLAADSRFTTSQISDILKKLPGETKDVLLRPVNDANEAVKLIEELTAIGGMFSRNEVSADQQQELLEIIAERIVAIELQYTTGG